MGELVQEKVTNIPKLPKWANTDKTDVLCGQAVLCGIADELAVTVQTPGPCNDLCCA